MSFPELSSRERMLRRLGAASGTLLVLQAAAILVVLVITGAGTLLPVTADLAGVGRRTLASVDLGPALVVLCLIAASFRALTTAGPLAPGYFGALRRNRHLARWIEFSLTSSITVFLIAALNGISDIGALVAIYALTSGMTLLSVLQERGIRFGHPRLALQFGAAIGIVPWGIIAFHELVAGLLGGGPTVLLRIITLAALIFGFVFAITYWREQMAVAAGADPLDGERMFHVLSLASVSVFVWLALLGILRGG